ncbi:translation initiation factor Sui1 [uncultured Desulfobacter sp.]|uniref:translation initiation factor Sui1 n=1 Tax=uncultured Desulfobacter sp. TaxID=240139 RepID=UPI002AAAF187|nr:translation initiation factor Sui1 [uncultured Desulfobacter sp.]
MKNRDSNSRLVYSTESGRICPSCGKQAAKCICKKKNTHTSPRGDGQILVERSTKGRKGKGVTLITGLTLESTSLRELAKELKQKCGTGGTVKNGTIEIQGDHRDLLTEHLNSLGYKAKKAGG